jgi:hypothetical protein
MMWRKILLGSTNFNSSYFVFCCCEQISTLNSDPNVVVPNEPCFCECECLDCSLESVVPSFSRIVHWLSTVKLVSWVLPNLMTESPCCFWKCNRNSGHRFCTFVSLIFLYISTPKNGCWWSHGSMSLLFMRKVVVDTLWATLIRLWPHSLSC